MFAVSDLYIAFLLMCRAPNDNAGCYSAQLTKFLTKEYVGWYWAIRKVALMVLLIFFVMLNPYVDGPYVDDVSITYDTPRVHI